MGENLVQLAEQFVRLSGELTATRDAMKRLLLNGGAGEDPHVPFVRPPPERKRNPTAAEAEQKILDLLRERPGLRTGEIMKATAATGSTVALRLQRLKSRGAIVGGGAEGYTVSATP